MISRKTFDRIGRPGAWAATLLLALLAGTAFPSAATAVSFQVSPTRFEFSLTKRFTNFFTLTNNSEQTLRVRVYPKFIEIGEGNEIVEKTGAPYDLSPWMVFNPRLLTIRPAQKRTVRFSVRPPRDLEEGEYRAVVFFEELPTRADAPRPKSEEREVALQLKLLTRVGVTLYGMAGKPRQELKVGGKPAVTTAGKTLTISTPLENKGNIHLHLNIKVALYDAEDGKVHESESTVVVQRGQQRNWVFEMQRPAPGPYRFVATGTSNGEALLNLEVPIEVSAQ